MNSPSRESPATAVVARQLASATCGPAMSSAAFILAHAAVGRIDRLEDVYRAALGLGVGLDRLREATLMIPLFAGFPRTIEAFSALERAAGSLPPMDPSTVADRREAGAQLFAKIYGRQTDAVRKRLVTLHPELEDAIITDAYGRVLSRPGIEARDRELMAVCALAAIPLPRQLRSHILGAVRCGASREEVREMLDLARLLDDEAASSVAALFDEVLSR